MRFTLFVNAIKTDNDFSRSALADHTMVLHPDDLNLATPITGIVVVQNLSDAQHFHLDIAGDWRQCRWLTGLRLRGSTVAAVTFCRSATNRLLCSANRSNCF
jgi:hypothetical protein